MKLKNKVVVVTGGASGIGRALVEKLLDRGARVAAVDLDGDALAELAVLGVGERLSTHVANITDRPAVDALPEAVIAHHGAVDGLVNNAGVIQPFVHFDELEDSVIHRMIDVNLLGTIWMTRAFLPHLRGRPSAHVVNVSSMGGFMPFPGQTMYGAAKAAVKLLTEGLYGELDGTSVDVSVVMPGAVSTSIAENSGVEMSDVGAGSMNSLAPERAAKIILDGMEAGRLHILVGRDAKMLSWLSRLAPAWGVRLVQRQVRKTLGL